MTNQMDKDLYLYLNLFGFLKLLQFYNQNTNP